MKTGKGWTVLTEDSSPNFCNKEGDAYLVKCPKCEN